MSLQTAPIGIFDSGVGGLSVVRAVQAQFPHESVLYIADQAHVPYGQRLLAQVRGLAHAITRFLLARGAKQIVVACNTASAAALHDLRKTYSPVPFVGMEPAVKPAAEDTRSGVVGVLATPATFQGKLYASVIERFARGVTVLQDTCPGLVEHIEQGELHGGQARAILEKALDPMLARGIDTVVLGCTHYAFVIPLIQAITGPDVRVIDPAPAVARQAGRLLAAGELRNPGPQAGKLAVMTTGEPHQLHALLPDLLGISTEIQGLDWDAGHLQTRNESTLSRPGHQQTHGG